MSGNSTETELQEWACQYVANLNAEIDVLLQLLNLSDELNCSFDSQNETSVSEIRKEQARIGKVAEALSDERSNLSKQLAQLRHDWDEHAIELTLRGEIMELVQKRRNMLVRLKKSSNRSVVMLKDQLIHLRASVKPEPVENPSEPDKNETILC